MFIMPCQLSEIIRKSEYKGKSYKRWRVVSHGSTIVI